MQRESEQGPYAAVGEALEVIPRTLAQNCGANVIRTLTKLRAKHADPTNKTFGIDGNSGSTPAILCMLDILLSALRLPGLAGFFQDYDWTMTDSNN